MKNIRQKLFYDTLVDAFAFENDEYLWCDKEYIAHKVNGTYSAQVGEIASLYKINHGIMAHDICVTMNHDRLAINENFDFEKIILVKDNKFKIASREETIAEEKRVREAALKLLWRVSLLRSKRLQNKQIVYDYLINEEKVIETFGLK